MLRKKITFFLWHTSMNKIFIILFLIIFILIYKQNQYINNLPYTKSYEIIQANNPDKETYEDIMSERKPAYSQIY